MIALAAALAVIANLPLTAQAFEDEAPADPTRQPQAAEMMPLAVHSTLLSIDRAGEHYVAVGDRGHILRSADGANWSQVPSPVRRMLTRVRFVDGLHGWAVGYDAAVLETTDGGQHWQVRHFDPDAWPLFDIHFPHSTYGIAIGARGQMLESADAGRNWELVENEITDLRFSLNRLLRLNDGTLLAVGERGMLIRSTDGGERWEMLKQPYVGTWFDAIALDEHGVLLLGLRGHAYRADDVSSLATEDPITWDEYAAQSVEDPQLLAEMGWQRLPTGTRLSLFAATRLADEEVLVGGANGLLLRSEDGVRRFRRLAGPTRTTIASLLTDGKQVITAGRHGINRLRLDTLRAAVETQP